MDRFRGTARPPLACARHAPRGGGVKPFGFTWFRRVTESRGLPMSWTRAELASELRAAPAMNSDDKRALPLMCPATFRDNVRRRENVETVSMLGLDFDEPTDAPGEALRLVHEALGGVELFAHTTSSSEPGAFRLRMFVPYTHPVTADEHEASWRIVERVLVRAGVRPDPACKDAGRGFFLWARPRNGAYLYKHVPGVSWPPVLVVAASEIVELKGGPVVQAERGQLAPSTTPLPAKPARPPPGRPFRGRNATGAKTPLERAAAYAAALPPAISGQGGSTVTFSAAARILHGFALSEAEALAVLRDHFNPRCEPPWTERELARKVRDAAARAQAFPPGYLLERAREAS